MKSKILLFIPVILFTLICFIGCKSNEGAKPATSPEITSLSNYYATVAKVNLSKVIYNQTNDTFSINGHAVISHAELLKNYKNSQTGRIQ